jgi:hypothetical protein
MKAENILLLGGLGLIFYWLYSKDKEKVVDVKVIDVEPTKVSSMNTTTKEIIESKPSITTDEATKVDTKAKTIVLDLNASERKKFSQRIPDAIVKDFDTSKEKTIMNDRISVKVV